MEISNTMRRYNKESKKRPLVVSRGGQNAFSLVFRLANLKSGLTLASLKIIMAD